MCPVFFGCNISGLENNVYWFDVSFGRYILAAVVLMILLALGFACYTFVFSRFCRNYVSILAVLIPLAVAGNFLCGWIYQSLFSVSKPRHGEIIICLVVFLTGLLVSFLVGKREKKLGN